MPTARRSGDEPNSATARTSVLGKPALRDVQVAPPSPLSETPWKWPAKSRPSGATATSSTSSFSMPPASRDQLAPESVERKSPSFVAA